MAQGYKEQIPDFHTQNLVLMRFIAILSSQHCFSNSFMQSPLADHPIDDEKEIMFANIKIEGWRQFRTVDIDFHPRLTVLTGANGAGKTTLLSLISRHLGWGGNFIGTPRSRAGSNSLEYSSDTWAPEAIFGFDPSIRNEGIREKLLNVSNEGFKETSGETNFQTAVKILQIERASKLAQRFEGPLTIIGSITYESGVTAKLKIPSAVGQQYDVHIAGQQPVEGVHIPSHRTVYSYQQIQNIPTVPRRRNEVFNQYVSILRQRFAGGSTQWSPQYYMKETLIALAMFGYGNAAVLPDCESIKIFEDFQEVLKKMLPINIGFEKILIQSPEVMLQTKTGVFSIDSLSGGVSAVVDLAWQIFMFQPLGSRFVVTLDEPENHLHPALQRRVLSDLMAAFPNVQFVVATHSPFIVGSVPDSNVYVLAYDDNSSVSSSKLTTANKAGSANDILRDVLGVDITIPIWAEEQIQNLIKKYSDRNFDKTALAELKNDLTTIGMGGQIPETVASVVAAKDRQ